MKILVVNGPNLDMLGKRNAEHYGSFSLDKLNCSVKAYGEGKGAKIKCVQTNDEGKMIDILHKTKADGVILNAGAFTHYSYALRDAVEILTVPVAEVHLSDVENREDFRKVDVFDGVVAAKFCGKKMQSYFDAVDFLVKQ